MKNLRVFAGKKRKCIILYISVYFAEPLSKEPDAFFNRSAVVHVIMAKTCH